MRWVPFTAHVRVVPARGKRFEYIRDLQKIATRVYDELVDDSTISIATPGGGQHQSFSGHRHGGLSGMTDGLAVKPQIGQTPAQIQITGFLDSSDDNAPVHPDKQLLHTGNSESGVGGGHGWLTNPNAEVDTYVSSVKTSLETALTTVLGSTDWNVFRIDIAGVVYGDRGYHFPR